MNTAPGTNSKPRSKQEIESCREKPVPLAVIPDNIPPELRSLPQWVCWQWWWDPKRNKWTKPPKNASTGWNASSTDPKTWVAFQVALEFYSKSLADGIGFVVNGHGIVGIDLDNARDLDTGELTQNAVEIVRDFSAYTEVSPSGTGLRIFCLGTMPEDGRKVGDVEFFQAKKYLTVTGDKLPGCPVSLVDRQPQLTALYERIFTKKANNQKAKGSATHDLFHGNLTDAEIVTKASAAANGGKFSALWSGNTDGHGGDDSAADLALCSILAFYVGPDAGRIDSLLRQSGLYREKWERPDYRERTIAKALEGRTDFYNWAARQPSTNGSGHKAQLPATGDDGEPTEIHLTDCGNARRLVQSYGAVLRHCGPWRKWLVWDGKRWGIDDSAAVVRNSKLTIAKLFAWATGKIQEIQKTLEVSADA